MAKAKERYQQHLANRPDELINYRKDYYAKNRAKILTQTKNYQKENYDKLRSFKKAASNRRRARLAGQAGEHSGDDIRNLYDFQDGCCHYCHERLINYHADHLIPLARGGSNDLANIVLACPSCNLAKGSKMPWEFSGGRFF
ncbi:MAG: HNH endonuclease [Alphaproteobacteria bacterium]